MSPKFDPAPDGLYRMPPHRPDPDWDAPRSRSAKALRRDRGLLPEDIILVPKPGAAERREAQRHKNRLNELRQHMSYLAGRYALGWRVGWRPDRTTEAERLRHLWGVECDQVPYYSRHVREYLGQMLPGVLAAIAGEYLHV